MEKIKIENITPQQARELLNQNQERISQQEFIILDVRTKEEYQKQHLPSALNLDFYQADFSERLAKLDRNKTYLVHCRSGTRSTKTIELMSQLHFRYLYNVLGFLFPEP